MKFPGSHHLFQPNFFEWFPFTWFFGGFCWEWVHPTIWGNVWWMGCMVHITQIKEMSKWVSFHWPKKSSSFDRDSLRYPPRAFWGGPGATSFGDEKEFSALRDVLFFEWCQCYPARVSSIILLSTMLDSFWGASYPSRLVFFQVTYTLGVRHIYGKKGRIFLDRQLTTIGSVWTGVC